MCMYQLKVMDFIQSTACDSQEDWKVDINTVKLKSPLVF